MRGILKNSTASGCHNWTASTKIDTETDHEVKIFEDKDIFRTASFGQPSHKETVYQPTETSQQQTRSYRLDVPASKDIRHPVINQPSYFANSDYLAVNKFGRPSEVIMTTSVSTPLRQMIENSPVTYRQEQMLPDGKREVTYSGGPLCSLPGYTGQPLTSYFPLPIITTTTTTIIPPARSNTPQVQSRARTPEVGMV